MMGSQRGCIIMPSDETQQPKLPQHDWAQSELYITPSAHRFIDKEGAGMTVDGYEQLKTKCDTSVVTIRPKHYIGSSGSVWASDYMHIRYVRPDLFEKEDSIQQTRFSTRKAAAFLSDTVNYYVMSTLEEDFMRLTKSSKCQFRLYELEKVDWLIRRLELAQRELLEEDNEETQQLKECTQMLRECGVSINLALKDIKSENNIAWNYYRDLEQGSHSLCEKLQDMKVPQPRPFIIEYTDAGPGVACNNYDVKFREVEIAKLHKTSLRYRVHLATDDQGQNEAERTNAYIGEAVSDGCPLKTDYVHKHQGLSDEDKAAMTIQQLTSHESQMMEKNAWCIAEDVAVRIDSEPGPGGSYMQSFVTHRKDYQFFYNTEHMTKWRKCGKQARKQLPGHNYFSMVENVVKSHMEVGELYLEFSACSTCDYCKDITSPIIEPVPQPHPDPETGHYMTYDNTTGYVIGTDQKRPTDEYQPRIKCKKMYEEGKLMQSTLRK